MNSAFFYSMMIFAALLAAFGAYQTGTPFAFFTFGWCSGTLFVSALYRGWVRT